MSMVAPGYRKRTIFLLITLLLVRFWFGQTFEITGPEASIWLQGHGANLSPAYWERGPLAPFLVRAGTLFFGDTELGIRWLAAVIACATGFILFYLARLWYNARAAFWTVVLFIVTPMYAWKLCFMTDSTACVGLMALALLAIRGAVEEDRFWWWLLTGVTLGLSLLVALPNSWWALGLLIYFVVAPSRRPRLTEALLWASILLAILFLLPIIWWWRGAQVADVQREHIWNTLPLSHPFSLHQGLKAIWLEIFYLGPLLFGFMIYTFIKLGRQLRDDSHYALLFWLPVPGLIWEAFSAFFHEGKFDLLPALFLPWVLLCGCYLARLTRINRSARTIGIILLVAAILQSAMGLNQYYYIDDRYTIQPVPAHNIAASVYVNRDPISWRNLSLQAQRLKEQEGAQLILMDDPFAASALSFYLPLHPAVFVISPQDKLTQFDFWPQYWDQASPSDSALYLSLSSDTPNLDVTKDFESYVAIKDSDNPPDHALDWHFWSLQKFKPGMHHGNGALPNLPPSETDSLPK